MSRTIDMAVKEALHADEAAREKATEDTMRKENQEKKVKKAAQKNRKEDETEKQGKRLRGRPRKVASESSRVSHHEDEACDSVESDDEESVISSTPRKRLVIDTLIESVKSYFSSEMRELKKELDALKRQQEPHDRDASAAKIAKEVL